MANHKSAKKRIRTNAKKKLVNKISESRVKTYIKKALNSTEKAEAEVIYKEAVSIIDKQSSKGRLHKNAAARKKATLTRHLNSLKPAVAAAETK